MGKGRGKRSGNKGNQSQDSGQQPHNDQQGQASSSQPGPRQEAWSRQQQQQLPQQQQSQQPRQQQPQQQQPHQQQPQQQQSQQQKPQQQHAQQHRQQPQQQQPQQQPQQHAQQHRQQQSQQQQPRQQSQQQQPQQQQPQQQQSQQQKPQQQHAQQHRQQPQQQQPQQQPQQHAQQHRQQQSQQQQPRQQSQQQQPQQQQPQQQQSQQQKPQQQHAQQHRQQPQQQQPQQQPQQHAQQHRQQQSQQQHRQQQSQKSSQSIPELSSSMKGLNIQGRERSESTTTTSISKIAPASSSQVSSRQESNKQSLPEEEIDRLLSRIPHRRSYDRGGKAGRPITVYTNMVSIMFDKNFKDTVTHYDVKFDPDKPKFLTKIAFEALRNKKFSAHYPAFDGRVNVFSSGDLPFGHSISETVEIFDEERQQTREFKVTMTKVNVINMAWLKNIKIGMEVSDKYRTSIQALDIILRGALINRAIPVGRSFFRQPQSNERYDLSGGMELYPGIFQSAVIGWKPFFNIDVANKAFPKSANVLEIMTELCANFRNPTPVLTASLIKQNFEAISKFLTGLKVIYQPPDKPSMKRTVGINGLDKSACDALFELDNGQKVTVEQYFIGSKNYKIKNPDLPCLWVGSRAKRILLPPELCTVAPKLITNKKLNEEQTRNMIRKTATAANIRKEKIERSLREINYNQNPTMREFGISLNGSFEEVNARVLEPPSLQYAQNNIQARRGVWQASKFYSAQKIAQNTWTILHFSNRPDERILRSFSAMLQTFGKDNGMDICDPQTPFCYIALNRGDGAMTREVLKFLEQKKANGIQLIVVIIPSHPPDIYQKVKQLAELKVGVLTQCIKEVTLKKMIDRKDKSTAGNILLKINSKLNGINHTLTKDVRPQCLSKPTIIFGADVTHPSPDAVNIPSIAAVAASSSQDVFKYNIELRIQPAREELILDLENIVYKQLKNFIDCNKGIKPVNIIFYRDGVGEGQFPQIMNNELQAIRNACAKFDGGQYQPKITFFVVQKRHHTRFFPTNPRNSDDKCNNVQAGTIVDTKITHPSHIDFYLVSHASIQGTARPTKYRCLCDDSNMSEDEIEILTYYLCHMFSRCNRSVSYPAPTYYAHLAAFRARALILGVPIKMDNLAEAQKSIAVNRELMNNNPMFFV